MSNIELNEQMLVSAVRYAFGRATYIVAMTVEEVLRVWPELSPGVQVLIRSEVNNELHRGDVGMIMDRIEWERLMEETKNAVQAAV